VIETQCKTIEKDGAIKKGIIASVIASIIIIGFIQPLIQFIAPKFFAIISNSYSFLSNSIYSNAALGIRYTAGNSLIYLITGCIFGIATAMIVLYLMGKNGKNFNCKNIIFSKKLPILLAIALIMSALLLMGEVMIEDVNIQLNLSFQQRLIILGPYLTDNEEKTLKSKWASMTNTNGYNEVNKQLTDIAEKYHVNIPKPF